VAKFILAYDLGTTGNKSTIFDLDGDIIASNYFEYPTKYFGDNCVEQNPLDWWRSICDSTKKFFINSKITNNDISCVSFSGHMMGCVAVNKKGEPLRNSIIWADSRSVKQANSLIKKVGMENGYEITGHRLLPMYSAAKIMWIKDNEPQIFKDIHKILHTKDFIVNKLTGKFVTDYSDASGMNLFDLKKYEWSDILLNASEIPLEILPEVRPSTNVVGEVNTQASEETGLRVGTPVVIGGGDGPCAGAGAGVFREGEAYNYYGSAAWIGIASKKPIYDREMRTFTFYHLDPKIFMPIGASNNGGYSFQWFRNEIWRNEKILFDDLGLDIYKIMDEKSESIRDYANLLFLPYIRGERCPYDNPNARGVFFGITPNHTKEHFTRAVLEGVTFNQKIILECFENQGVKIKDIIAIGGGAKSKVWLNIMANIYNKRILKPKLLQEATSLGAAIAGGIGVGLFKDFEEARKMIKIVESIEPVAEENEKYEKIFPFFKELYSMLKPAFEKMAAIKISKY